MEIGEKFGYINGQVDGFDVGREVGRKEGIPFGYGQGRRHQQELCESESYWNRQLLSAADQSCPQGFEGPSPSTAHRHRPDRTNGTSQLPRHFRRGSGGQAASGDVSESATTVLDFGSVVTAPAFESQTHSGESDGSIDPQNHNEHSTMAQTIVTRPASGAS